MKKSIRLNNDAQLILMNLLQNEFHGEGEVTLVTPSSFFIQGDDKLFILNGDESILYFTVDGKVYDLKNSKSTLLDRIISNLDINSYVNSIYGMASICVKTTADRINKEFGIAALCNPDTMDEDNIDMYLAYDVDEEIDLPY